MGCLERNEPLPLDQPDRKALVRHKPLLPGRFCTIQRGPQPSAPAAHASASRGRLPHSRKATDEDMRLARRYQGYGGTRFVEDDLAGDPEAGALASNGQGPPSITDRLRSTADGAQAAADLIGAGAAGLGTLAGAAGVGAAATAGLAVGIAGGAAGLARGTGWVLENTLFRPQQGSEDAVFRPYIYPRRISFAVRVKMRV